MSLRYLPVVVCSEHDSPLDALLALHVAQDDAADAVAAALHACDGDFAPGFAVLAETDGGRPVATVRSETGRWVAGNAFPDKACATAAGAERELTRLVKRGRRGLVAQI